MTKRKKKQQQSPSQLSDTAYLKSGRARKLPLYECFINSSWKEAGMGNIVVSRQHVNGNVSFGFFLVDLYCLGVKDAGYIVNVSEFRYRDFLVQFSEAGELVEIAYTKVHNIIYGGLAFAEDYGFAPHSDFKWAQMILEEDTDEIPLIEYEFGVEGKPRLVVEADDPRLSFHLNTLDKYAGEGNYDLVYLDDLIEEENDEEIDFDELFGR